MARTVLVVLVALSAWLALASPALAAPDADGDGMPDSVDLCPTMPGNGWISGCPPPGTPTIRTEPVQITPGGVLFRASGNPMGNGGFVRFQVSLARDFTPLATVDGPFDSWCYQKTGLTDVDGKDEGTNEFKFGLNTGFGAQNLESAYQNQVVDCTPNHDSSAPQIFELGHPFGYSSYTNRYVRAVYRYTDTTGVTREISGGGQTYIPPGRYSGRGGAATDPSLKKALAVAGPKARIRALLEAGSFSATYTAPSAGKAEIVWRYMPRAKSAAKRKAVVVARGTKKAAGAGKIKVKVRLTKAGRALIQRSKKVKLVAEISFKPRSGGKVTSKRSITLKR